MLGWPWTIQILWHYLSLTLPRVCSSMVAVMHLACLAHMIVQRGVHSVGAMRKSWV